MNTTNSNAIQDIVNKIPVTLFFEQLPDRKQALKYINWLFTNIPQSYSVVQDQLFREVISKELRIVSMKIIEIEILFMIALNTITLEDFTLDHNTLIKKIISENPDKNDLDLMYRILAQIMTKLPMDLRDKVTGKHKLQIFNSISRFINMEPKLLERFISFNPSLNTPISMDLDAGDYNTLNKKYLDELAKFEKSHPYIDSNSLEYSTIANNMNTKPTLGNNIKGQYIDTSPDLMTGVNDNKLYYFDSSSGTISEFPITNQEPVSLNDLTNVLSANKVNKGQINDLIQSLQPSKTTVASITVPNTVPNTVPITTHPISFLNSLKSLFYSESKPLPATNCIPSTQSPPSVPLVTVASITLPPTAPLPPQYILSQSSEQQKIQQQQQRNYSPMEQIQERIYSSMEQQQNYNPNDFINPKVPLPGDFNILPQSTSDFLTRNDACDLPNPPARCPIRTNPSLGINNNLERKFKERESTYEPINHISPFSNMNSNSINENAFIEKLTKKNKDIENVAIAFVSIIVLLFLLVIFNSIRNKSGLVNTK
jgi:hypothetical protein